jgi:hypothetical protein
VLVSPNDGAVEVEIFEIGILCQLSEQAVQHALIGPPGEAPVIAVPGAETLRKVSPRHCGSKNMQDGFYEEPVIGGCPPGIAAFAGQQRRDSIPLVVSK